ncbi:MAG: hypothetical protein AB8U25_06675 [Rickettsiales endosymbiont of Dermacentor nuttalli]
MSLRSLIKGLINDDLETCWKFQEIIDWYSRKQLSVIDTDDVVGSSYNIMFNTNYYLNVRALTYNMQQNWDKSRSFIKEEIYKMARNDFQKRTGGKVRKTFKT